VIVAVTADPNGSVWIASDFALQRMKSTGVVETLSKESGLDGRILAVTAARDSSLWVSTISGVYHVIGGSAQKMGWKEDKLRGPVTGIREAADGSLWLSRVRGVDHLVDGRMMRFGREDGLVTRRIASITVDEKDGSVWVAMSDGLARIRDGRVRTYHAKDGLLSDSVYGVVQDLDGNLWIPTSRGLFTMKRAAIERFDAGDVDRLPIAVFRKSDGLRSSDFTGGMDRPGFRASDGNLWFPTTRGLVLVDPERLNTSNADPRVRIESIVSNSEKRQFDIAYTAPLFDSPESMTFRYKLEGFDDSWNEVGSRRTAFYTNVPPGKYRFVVQAMTAEGRMAQVATPIDVVPYFYETWLFRIASGLAVILLALVLHRRRIDAIQRHQDDLRKSEEHFRSLIENASDMILVVGVDDAIRYASPSVGRALGFGASAMTRRFLGDFLTDPKAGDAFLADVRGKGVHAATLLFLDDSGQRREVEVVGATYGEDSRVILNCRDVTDRRKLESQLEQATRLASLGRLAATVSHEFNNVLMGIQPFIDHIRRKSDDPAILRATTQMTQSVIRGKGISEEILRFTRPVDPTVRPIPVRSWLVDLETEMRSLVGQDMRLAIVAPNGLTLAGDVSQLNQVLTNLAINARDAGATSVRLEAGAVEGSGVFPFGIVLEPERFAHIRFSDNGSGISAAVLPKIFEPLFTTKLTKGTGLGLAVAHQVVARHGGELFVESRVGAGTTFHLFLPIAVSDSGELLTCDETVVTVDTPGCRILLIEDDTIVAEGMMTLLEDRGFHVDLAVNGGEALNLIPRSAPDVIVLDVGLPDIDGIELYGRIARKWPRLPVIFSTGHGDIASLEAGLPAPHPQCLLKPYTVETLISAIASAAEPDRFVA
jgi:PAS domain S-box-containing protein